MENKMEKKKTFYVQLSIYVEGKAEPFFTRYEEKGYSEELIRNKSIDELLATVNTKKDFVAFSNLIFKKEQFTGYLIQVYRKKWWQ